MSPLVKINEQYFAVRKATRCVIALWSMACFFGVAYSQSPAPVIISASEFFSSNSSPRSVWDMEIDSNGYVYMVSNGPTRVFDGQTLKTVPNYPESGDRDMYSAIFKDCNGRLWIKGLNGSFKQITKRGLVAHPHNEVFRSLARRVFEAAWMDRSGRWHFAPRGQGYYTLGKDGELTEVLGKSSGLHGFVVTHLEDGTPFHFSIGNPDSIKVKAGLALYYLNTNDSIIQLAKTSGLMLYESTLLAHPDSTMSLSMGTKDVLHFTRDSLLHHRTLKHNVLKLFEDAQGDIWIGTDTGLLRSKDYELTELSHWLPGDAAAVLAESTDGGLWLKSNFLKFGYIANPRMACYNSKNGSIEFDNIVSISTDFKKVYGLARGDSIVVLDGDRVAYLPIPDDHEILSQRHDGSEPYIIHCDTFSGLLWIAYPDHIASWDGKEWSVIRVVHPDSRNAAAITHIMAVSRDTLLVAKAKELFIIVDGKVASVISLYPLEGKMFSVAFDSSKTLWLSTTTGLFKYADSSLTPFLNVAEKHRGKLCLEVIYSQKRIWVEMGDRSFFILEEDSLKPVLDSEGNQVFITAPAVGHQGNIWALDGMESGGTYKISVHRGIPAITFFPRVVEQGYEVRHKSLAFTDHRLYLATSRGLLRGIALAPDKEPSNDLLITEVRVNHRVYPDKQNYKLSRDENSILVSFGLVNFRMTARFFRSRLLGLDSTWLESDYTTVQYTNLAHGDYTFELQARLGEGKWGAVTRRQFSIAPALYELWWVRVLSVLGLVALGSGVFWLWARAKESRTKLEVKRLRAEQKALRAQMNPHFIFNALSSIQELVYNQDRVSALKNIALFARLMRQILEHSAQDQISLSEEVDILSNYLNLETMRFEGQITFHLNIPESLNLEQLLIPPMIIQPFVENAIKHGILNKKSKKGVVQVSFDLKNDQLQCVIEDDGVGRGASLKVQQRQAKLHQSFSTQSIRERILLINAQRKRSIQLSVTDLYDETNQPCGTRIILSIPQPTPL